MSIEQPSFFQINYYNQIIWKTYTCINLFYDNLVRVHDSGYTLKPIWRFNLYYYE